MKHFGERNSILHPYLVYLYQYLTQTDSRNAPLTEWIFQGHFFGCSCLRIQPRSEEAATGLLMLGVPIFRDLFCRQSEGALLRSRALLLISFGRWYCEPQTEYHRTPKFGWLGFETPQRGTSAVSLVKRYLTRHKNQFVGIFSLRRL